MNEPHRHKFGHYEPVQTGTARDDWTVMHRCECGETEDAGLSGEIASRWTYDGPTIFDPDYFKQLAIESADYFNRGRPGEDSRMVSSGFRYIELARSHSRQQ